MADTASMEKATLQASFSAQEDQPQPTSCCTNPLQTPHLNTALHTPAAKTHLLALSSVLAKVAHEDYCASCTAKEIGRVMLDAKKDFKAGKEGWAREERRAMKKEMRVLTRTVKGEMKGWKRG